MTQDDRSSALLISSDSHVIEPHDLWEKHLPAAFRERAPKYRPTKVGETNSFTIKPGGMDPSKRVAEMSQDGVSGEVLYPSLAMDQYGIEDPVLQEACFRVYNDWLIDYCSHAPGRLLGAGMISTYDIGRAVTELERCRKAGLRGALLWQVPPESISFDSRHYERFWASAQDLEMPVSFHILTGTPFPIGALAKPRSSRASFRLAVNDKLHHVANTLLDLTISGVLERYPKLKLVLVENEVSWLPFILSQWDKYAARGVWETPMKLPPSEYFRRQVYATFFNDPPTRWLFGQWGEDNCMWSNDFPHLNSTWPHSREVIARDLGALSDQQRVKLQSGNVRRLYNLTKFTSVPQPPA